MLLNIVLPEVSLSPSWHGVRAASIPVVGFNAILMSEHFGAFLAFGILHAALAISYIKVLPQGLSHFLHASWCSACCHVAQNTCLQVRHQNSCTALEDCDAKSTPEPAWPAASCCSLVQMNFRSATCSR